MNKVTTVHYYIFLLCTLFVVGCAPEQGSIDEGKCDGYEMLADEGQVVGQIGLAECYRKGIGRKKDLNKAELWYLNAVKNENLTAYQNLASLYLFEMQDTQKYEHAHLLLDAGINKDNPRSFFVKGVSYLNGVGVDKNLSKSISLFEEAARLNHEESIFVMMLGYCSGSLSIPMNPENCEDMKNYFKNKTGIEDKKDFYLYVKTYKDSELFRKYVYSDENVSDAAESVKLYD